MSYDTVIDAKEMMIGHVCELMFFGPTAIIMIYLVACANAIVQHAKPNLLLSRTRPTWELYASDVDEQ